MKFEMTEGVLNRAQRVVIYGVEGIGKTLLAAKFPDVVFIDTEGSTDRYPLRRLPKPTSRTILFDEIRYVIQNHMQLNIGTLCIDTLDWAELLVVQHLCDKFKKEGIEDFGYGNGYTYLKEEIEKLLKLLDEVIDCGVHVVLTCHAQLHKQDVPGEMGSYDRWELKLGKKTTNQVAPLVKEWADMLLFLNYETFVVAKDDQGKKFTATGGQKRMMYCTHTALWDAKNRHGLPDKAEMDYRILMPHILEKKDLGIGGMDVLAQNTLQAAQQMAQPVTQTAPTPMAATAQPSLLDMAEDAPADDGIPRALRDLMTADGVSAEQIQAAVTKAGFFPAGTPIANYGEQFINGMLVAQWSKVKGIIAKI